MIRGTKLINNKNMSIKKTFKKIVDADYIYIPLVTYKNKNIYCDLKIGDYVYKGQVLAKSDDMYNCKVISSVSGTIKDIKPWIYIDNTMVNTIIIENDFLNKEKFKKGAKKNISKYTSSEIIKLMKDNGVVGMSGSAYPTHFKYGMDLKINKLIVNAVEDEVYITSDFTNLNDKPSEILEAIDALMQAFKIGKCVIAIKDFNEIGIKDFINYMGTYPNIKIKKVPDKYPVGYEKNLASYIYDVKIKKNPMERSIMVNNISTIYEIYRVLKYERPITGRIITISGNAVKNPQNIYVKFGTLLSDIIKNIGGLKYKDIVIIINGPMMGNSVSSMDIPITASVIGITIQKNYKDEKTHDCISCGKCVNVCPVRLAPTYIKKYKNHKNILKLLNPNKCIRCGLCSYICPSKIDLRRDVIDACEVVKNEDKY